MKSYKITAQVGVRFTNEDKTDSATVIVSARNEKEAWAFGENQIRKTHRICIVTDIVKI